MGWRRFRDQRSRLYGGFVGGVGLLLHVLGDGVAGELAAEFGEDGAALSDGHFKVGGAVDAVELVEVVRGDADGDEALA